MFDMYVHTGCKLQLKKLKNGDTFDSQCYLLQIMEIRAN